MRVSKVFFWGMVISFLGSLPLGVLNLVTTYISVAQGVGAGLLFCTGCIISELIFVRLAVISMGWISQRQKLFKRMEWVMVALILVLVIFSFRAAINKTGFTSAMPTNIKHPFWYGLFISTIDPMKIPFWYLWTTYLMSNNVLIPKNIFYNFYVAGIGIGSLFGFLLFIYGGTYLVQAIQSHQDILNWSIGGILLITVVIQIYRLMHPKELTNTVIVNKPEDLPLPD